MKRVLFLSLVTGIVISTVAMASTPYATSPRTPKVVIKTVAGDIIIELFPDKAPVTVENFLQYVDSGFYDGLIIHRVTKEATFKVVQGGGYLPGGVQKTEGLRAPIINESYNGLSNLRATVAMARTSNPNSATSQFYINVTDNTSLDGTSEGPGYAVFGQVISGMSVVDQIQQLPLKPPAEAGGQTECPSYNGGWVTVSKQQQIRMFVSTTGSDSTGNGSNEKPFKTIQKGIDIIGEWGHVIVGPGTYTGTGNRDLDFKGKLITLRTIEPRDANTVIKTVIDCQGSPTDKHRAIYFHDEEDANTLVEGLTIINGYQDRGGAIWCQSDPTIKNCIFAKNTAASYGGGVYCYDSDAVITNCTFSDNNAPSKGGGLYVGYNSHVTLSNSILWNNISAAGHEIAVSIASPASSLTAFYNDVKGSRPEVYVQSGCSVNWKAGNIDDDPCFVDAANKDYHLQSRQKQWKDGVGWQTGVNTSPCIDSGNPGTPLGNEPNVPANIRIDMGAFGGTTKASYPPVGWGLRADIDNDGATDEIDFALFAGYWQTKGSEQPADLDFSRSVDLGDLKLFCDDWLKITSE